MTITMVCIYTSGLSYLYCIVSILFHYDIIISAKKKLKTKNNQTYVLNELRMSVCFSADEDVCLFFIYFTLIRLFLLILYFSLS